jgi:Raf kinase inhibitor-like YbhB/YbcL family protein
MCFKSNSKSFGKLATLTLFSSGLLSSMTIGGLAADNTPANKEASSQKWEITSKSFQEGQRIPKLYTADGKDISPPLTWSAPPEKTQTLALICDDPDAPAGTWVHWLIYDLPSGQRALAENVRKEAKLDAGIAQGMNSFNKIGYNGPSPPPGETHRYFFKLYALDSKLSLGSAVKKDELEAAMKNHVLAETQLMGTYSR